MLKDHLIEKDHAKESLRESRHLLQSMIDGMPEAVYLKDLQGRYVLVNAAGCNILNRPAEDIIGQDDADLFPHSTAQRIMENDRRLQAQGRPHTYEEIVATADGSSIYETTKIIYRNAEGENAGLIGISRDVTELRRDEQERAHFIRTLEDERARLANLFKHAPAFVAVLSGPQHVFEFINQPYQQLIGHREVIGKPIREVLPELKEQGYFELLDKVFLTGKVHTGTENPVFIQRQQQGPLEERTLDFVYQPVFNSDGSVSGIFVHGVDNTTRKRAEDSRKLLLQRLYKAQEEERHRIARELHDQLAQYFAAQMMGLKSFQKSIGFASPLRDQVIRLQDLTRKFSHEVRHLALELRPTVLDDFGLYVALSNYVEEWAQRTGIKIDFHGESLARIRLQPDIETSLYRLTQEALNNILKHAQARHVSIVLEYRGALVHIVLEDDGVGFEIEDALSAPLSERGRGLTGMRERVESVGGMLDLESSPGAGTTIVARIPARALNTEPEIDCD